MSLKIFHTADIHLGLSFQKYENLAPTLIEARFETLKGMVETANAGGYQIFVVGGDMFDTIQVKKGIVTRAAQILSEFEGLVLVLPGNHDYVTGTAEDNWNKFIEASGDRVLVLREPRCYPLEPYGIDANVYAAPCTNKHSKTHAVSWLEGIKKDPEVSFHIGLAHGSYEGLSPDLAKDYYPMKRGDLERHGLDIWLMGHIHKQFPVTPGDADRVFYPATPEPDGFDCRHEGKAWTYELERGKAIRARSLSTGKYRFLSETHRIESIEELDAILEKYLGAEFANHLFKLSFEGYLSKEDHLRLPMSLKVFGDKVLHLRPDTSQVRLKLNPKDIDQEFTAESFPHQLLSSLSQDDDTPEALHLAYEMIQQLKKSK